MEQCPQENWAKVAGPDLTPAQIQQYCITTGTEPQCPAWLLRSSPGKSINCFAVMSKIK